MLDRTIDALAALIAVLLVTGGIRFHVGGARLELSQIDAFAWALLALMTFRFLRSGGWLTPGLDRLAERARRLLERRPRAVLGAAVTVYVVLHAWIAAWRYDSFRANAWDLGFMAQALWTTANGHGFLRSDMAQGGTYLGEHFSPALAIAALPFRITDSIQGLFVLQTLLLASAAVLAYRLGRAAGLERAASAFVGTCVLLYRPLRAANIFDFREDILFVPVFFGLMIALERKRWLWVWLLAIASWTVKESAPLLTACLGPWLAFGERRRAQGLAMLVFSLIGFYALTVVVTPHFVGEGQSVAARRLGEFGATNEEIAAYAVRHPLAFAGQITARILSPRSFEYLANVFAPFVAFAAAAPWAAATALAGALFNVAFVRKGVGFHYECALVPFLVYVLVKGLARRGPGALTTERLALVTLSFLLFFGRSPVATLREVGPTPRDRWVASVLDGLPREASVATQTALYPHVARRPRALLLPRDGIAGHELDVDYVAVDRSPSRILYDTPDLAAVAAELDARGVRRLLDRDSLVVWRLRGALGTSRFSGRQRGIQIVRR